VAETTSNTIYEEWDGRLSSRGNRTLALKANGTLWSWGANSLGELGTGNKVSTMTPTQIGTSNAWMKISAKGYDNLCLTNDGSLWGFGENASGLLGPTLDFTRPIRVIPTFSSQTVTFPPVSATIGTPIELMATASSGLPVVYGVSGPATVQGNLLTITAPGAVNLVAYQEGDASWRASDPVQTVLSIAPALEVQTITFPAIADRVPTSPAFTITASASSLLPVSFSLISGPATISGNTVTLTGAVGTVTIRSSQAGNASFAAANPETRSFTVASSGVLLSNWASSSGLSGPNTAPTATPFNMNAAGPDVRVLTSSGSSGLPQITVDSSGAEPVLKVAFLRRKGSGLIYTPQCSDTLGDFVAMTGTQTVTSIDYQWERVTVIEPAPPATAPRAFARVSVGLP
jgi:hypothetical protein